jgi:hypothetical protein
MTDDAISEEMVEAGARAINPAAWRDDVPEQWKERQPMLRDIARKSARAALAAAEPLIVARERERAARRVEIFADGGKYANSRETESCCG